MRGMGELLGLPLQDALAMAQQRPGLLLYDMPTLDSRCAVRRGAVRRAARWRCGGYDQGRAGEGVDL